MRFCNAIFLLSMIASSAVAETVVAAKLIRPPQIILADDVLLVEDTSKSGFESMEKVIGLEARRVLYQGQPIRPGDVGPPALIERNQLVKLIYSRGGLNILTDARSLSRGTVGDVVRAINLSSRTTVTGRVRGDGSVVVSH